jgi:hypothetical protein
VFDGVHCIGLDFSCRYWLGFIDHHGLPSLFLIIPTRKGRYDSHEERERNFVKAASGLYSRSTLLIIHFVFAFFSLRFFFLVHCFCLIDPSVGVPTCRHVGLMTTCRLKCLLLYLHPFLSFHFLTDFLLSSPGSDGFGTKVSNTS